jgi:hypothetical protein
LTHRSGQPAAAAAAAAAAAPSEATGAMSHLKRSVPLAAGQLNWRQLLPWARDGKQSEKDAGTSI